MIINKQLLLYLVVIGVKSYLAHCQIGYESCKSDYESFTGNKTKYVQAENNILPTSCG